MADPAQEAFGKGLAAIRRRERCRRELDQWLAKRGYEYEERVAALDRLEAVGELDDARFARRYAEDKRELSGWGPDRIRTALQGRGVATEHIDAALASEDQDRQL